jgi:hypothetical protein
VLTNNNTCKAKCQAKATNVIEMLNLRVSNTINCLVGSLDEDKEGVKRK